MSKQLGIRLTDEEDALVERAMGIEMQPGDRRNTAAWARRAIIREAQRVVDEVVSSEKEEGLPVK